MLLDSPPALIIASTNLLPIVQKMGIDPVHFVIVVFPDLSTWLPNLVFGHMR